MTIDMRDFENPVSLHPGAVQQRFIDEMRVAAAELLAPAVAEVVGVATEQPFLQVVSALYNHLQAHDGQLELGGRLLERAAAMGARSQVTNTWTPGDPDLLPGLYGPGR
ncbi:hypothetical protein C6A87_028795 [Mycobacterium sp. ITM-2016-00317]|nr:hypothetical protein [Mycobacterium sp. ITM-2016-00317]WNG87670.1 hypothetical protein C6A87_028795 [Mycobacterium sp. ITM-2016-00317]